MNDDKYPRLFPETVDYIQDVFLTKVLKSDTLTNNDERIGYLKAINEVSSHLKFIIDLQKER